MRLSSFIISCLLWYIPSAGRSEVKAPKENTKALQPLQANDLKEDKLSAIKDLQAKNILKNTVAKETDLETVFNLRLDNAQIATVEGFDNFKNLNHLSLSGNLINNIVPLTKIATLKTLDLSKNQIVVPSGLNLLKQLESLDLSHNQLKYAFCCLFVSLHHLKLNDNHIQQLIFINNFNRLLEVVDVSNNPLKSITIKAPLPSLKKLSANGTFITQINDLMHLQSLEELNLKNCIHLRSIAPLFYRLGDHWVCKLNHLKQLSISEEFLDNESKTILTDIKAQHGKLTIL